MSEPRKSLDDTGDDESSDDEQSYETPEEKRKPKKNSTFHTDTHMRHIIILYPFIFMHMQSGGLNLKSDENFTIMNLKP